MNKLGQLGRRRLVNSKGGAYVIFEVEVVGQYLLVRRAQVGELVTVGPTKITFYGQ